MQDGSTVLLYLGYHFVGRHPPNQHKERRRTILQILTKLLDEIIGNPVVGKLSANGSSCGADRSASNSTQGRLQEQQTNQCAPKRAARQSMRCSDFSKWDRFVQLQLTVFFF